MRTAIALLLLGSLSTLAAADDLAEPAREYRLAVGTDPIGLLGGRYALSATYVTSRRAALRGDVEIRDTPAPAGIGTIGAIGPGGGSGGSEWRAAVSLPVFLDRPLHGPYVEPGIAYAQRVTAYGYLGGLSDTMTPVVVPHYDRSIEPQIFVGWQWMFSSGLHLAGAVGVSRQSAGDGSGTSYARPESYLRIGIAL